MTTTKENIKTINMDMSLIGKPDYQDITIEQFKKRMGMTKTQLLWLCTVPGDPKIDKCLSLFDELVDDKFNYIWELQQNKKHGE